MRDSIVARNVLVHLSFLNVASTKLALVR